MSGLMLIFATVTQVVALPQGLLSAVCFVETRHKNVLVVENDGPSASYGVCQIKAATAKALGFTGTLKDLQDPEVNIYYAGLYLRKQLTRYDGDVVKAVAAYNAGTHRVNEKGLTKNRKYVGKVLAAWKDDR